MIKIPQNRIWKQDNRSDLYGDIASSWNLDLSSELGKLKTTRTLSVANSTDLSGLGVAGAFMYYDPTGSSGQHFAATTGTISSCGTSRTGAWGLVSTSGKPTTCSNRYSDMEIFNNILYVSVSGNTLFKNNAGTWTETSGITGVQSSVPHMLLQYADRLYITADAAKIQSINTSDTPAGTIGSVSSTIDLGNPYENTITKLLKTSSRIWILTINRNGNTGKVYAWDGDATSVNETYQLDSAGAWSGVVIDDVPYIFTVDGKLAAFNGGTFMEIDRLPLKTGEYLKFALGNYNERPVHPNGMDVLEGEILVLVNNVYRNSSSEIEERVPSGIWAWTKETGFYHKYGLSYMESSDTAAQDAGQNRISLAGALYAIKSTSDSASDNGTILASAQLYTDSGSTTQNHIFIDDYNDTKKKFGYFVTPKIFSPNLKDIWQKMILRIKKLTTSGDEIIIKYRVADEDPLEITISAWASSTAVNTAADISDYAAGDEIEFLQGQGSGMCFKIASTTSLGGGTTQILLDGSLPGTSGGTGKARLQHWKQVGESFSNLSTDLVEKTLAGIPNSAWVQFKVIINNTGNSYVYDAFLINQVAQPAK